MQVPESIRVECFLSFVTQEYSSANDLSAARSSHFERIKELVFAVHDQLPRSDFHK